VASPFADQAVLDLALAALDAGAAKLGTRFVAVSLSANDYIGHTFGPDSWEAWDELVALDAHLGRFFAALDARFGIAGWSAVLAADHGVTTMPEAAAASARARPWCEHGTDPFQRACGRVARVMPEALGAELAAAAEAMFHRRGLVAGVIDPYVYLSDEGRALPAGDKKNLLAALRARIAARPEVERVVDTGALPGTCPSLDADSVEALVCRSFVPGAAGELYIVLRPGSFFDPDIVPGKGTSHGSPWLFDRTVPLLGRAPGRIPAGAEREGPVPFTTFTRTLEALLGLPPRPPPPGERPWASLTE
jgi:hypothetical protein